MQEGGLQDEGGQVESTSGNDVPVGALKEEVADNIPAMVSEGEFIFPADVVRYIGLNTLMQMRQDAKQGLKMMEEMGQMGNAEEATLPDDMPFGMADLMIVGTGEPEEAEEPKEKAQGGIVEMQTGGLFDDPRFTSQGKAPPTLTDEDKKEIEDSLLGTVYGNIVMKRFVDADGNVKYIPHIDGKPQMPIPEGFQVDNSAPTPQSTISPRTTESSSGSDPSGEDPAFSGEVTNPFGDQGTASFDINKLSAKDLVKYYGSFSSPMNRYLSIGVGALFGGVPALAIGTMQQLSQTRGPNSLRATEKLLAQKVKNGEVSGTLLNELKELEKRAKEKGTGPTSFISKLIGKASGGDENKKATITSAFQQGDGKKFNTATKGIVIDPKEVMDIDFMDIDINEPEVEKIPNAISLKSRQDLATSTAKRATAIPLVERQGELQGLRKASQSDLFKTAFGLEGFDRARSSPYEAEGRSQLGSEKSAEKKAEERRAIVGDDFFGEAELGALGSRKDDEGLSQIGQRKKSNKRITTPAKPPAPKSLFGRTMFDDFLQGVKTDDKGNKTKADGSPISQKELNAIEENTQRVRDRTVKAYSDPTLSPVQRQEMIHGIDLGQSAQDFSDAISGNLVANKGGLAKLYVGGVPTKPMKPQTLKKGGLATPKVKPKRMKKGGLASKK